MARNEEKAQSMLYRFREAQAAELGLGTRADRRPKMASACKSLRECERWRGELLREISRKVSKIQDAGLTDYEVRDLNDEINKLMREKRHWENQIVALGGANYRRNVAMLDDDGREVPGTKGYKYFGRAKDLPGVRELFQSKKNEEDEENRTMGYYKKFTNQGPSYFGDLDEQDENLLQFEQDAEREDWEETLAQLRDVLGLAADDSTVVIPDLWLDGKTLSAQNATRKVDDDASTSVEKAKRPKTGGESTPPAVSGNPDQAFVHAQLAASYIPFLSPELLMPPKMPTRAEMEQILLELRKKALMDEYFGSEPMAVVS